MYYYGSDKTMETLVSVGPFIDSVSCFLLLFHRDDKILSHSLINKSDSFEPVFGLL